MGGPPCGGGRRGQRTADAKWLCGDGPTRPSSVFRPKRVDGGKLPISERGTLSRPGSSGCGRGDDDVRRPESADQQHCAAGQLGVLGRLTDDCPPGSGAVARGAPGLRR
ncbi:hypothetical protein GCM10022284_33830 [Streptomyces hundungensis]